MNKTVKVGIVVVLLIAVGVVIALKRGAPPAQTRAETGPAASSGVPRLLDLGSVSCIPCKMMAPILEDLNKEYAGRLAVDFIDVNVNPEPARQYGIRLIPTQIFFDASGKELWRHEGFISKEDILAKWKQLGFDFGTAALPKIERWEPAKKDTRSKDDICYMCDGNVHPKTAVAVRTDKGNVRMCSPHCYFIMYSCLTEDRSDFEKQVFVTDWATGEPVAATDAVYLCGAEEKSGRPWVKAFANRDAAQDEMKTSGGSIIGWEALEKNELSHRCGFCDRAVYPQDVAKVLIDGVHSYGCCAHCAMGVAARTGKNIEVHQADGLTGEMIVVRTLDGSVASVEPRTAVAWFGMRKKPDGTWGSAGCFHQGFFTTHENLRKWLEQHPFETGKMISIPQSLADKMKLTPQQISKACKIGECAPK